jgi:CHAT domain-containing protein
LEALQTSREVLGPRHPRTLTSLNNVAEFYHDQGRYGEAEPLYLEALQTRREELGPRHPDTLQSLNNLAELYQDQGRASEAEPLLKELLQASREVLGPRHPHTLTSLNNLARLYQYEGRYGEAEPLYLEALQTSREVLGPRNSDTLTSLNNLAELYQDQGRYGEAEQLLKESLQARRTLTSLNNLAGLYQDQGRYVEAEPLYLEALQARRAALGPRHPQTLTSLNNLAELYRDQGRYGEAEPLLKEVLQARREALGPRHQQTLTSLNNLAGLYQNQARYGEAEPLYLEVLRGSREALGPRHPDTLMSLHNRAGLYRDQGRYGEAEPLLKEALQASREALGPHHPNTLGDQLNMAWLLVDEKRLDEAVRTLQQMEPNLLAWVGQELYSTEGGAVRRQLVSSQANFQDAVLTLATTKASGEASRLAGSVLLHFKGMQGEEEAYLARLTRRSQDPRVQTLAAEVGKLRSALAAAARATEPGAFDQALQALEAKQQELGRISRDYKDHLRVQTANLDDLRGTLPVDGVLIEFREFQPVDFRTGKLGEPRFTALLLAGFDEPVVADLGPVSELRELTKSLMTASSTAPSDEAAAALYQRLFAPFESKLAAATSVFLAPDGILALVPFARLKLADGHYWEERQEVHLLQTSRDLLRADPDRPARGLLALGGIDFGAAATEGAKPDSVASANLSAAITRTAGTFREFAALPASGDEATQIKEAYQRLRKDEPAEAWTGADASKARLMALPSPPRVLHLATHGFYLPREEQEQEPMLFSGIALAGANRTLAGKGDDGILLALEAQGLNLEGSELVVLSACDTAQGSPDYSEGLYGLARAFRTAGARNVIVTLWPLNDGEARDFMKDFYRNWLSQARSDPAKALRDTQSAYLKKDDPARRDPRVWAPYILIE